MPGGITTVTEPTTIVSFSTYFTSVSPLSY